MFLLRSANIVLEINIYEQYIQGAASFSFFDAQKVTTRNYEKLLYHKTIINYSYDHWWKKVLLKYNNLFSNNKISAINTFSNNPQSYIYIYIYCSFIPKMI